MLCTYNQIYHISNWQIYRDISNAFIFAKPLARGLSCDLSPKAGSPTTGSNLEDDGTIWGVFIKVTKYNIAVWSSSQVDRKGKKNMVIQSP